MQMTIPETEDDESVRLRAVARLMLADQETRARYAADPWAFFQERISLIDPLAEQGKQVAPYPDFTYTKALVGELNTHRQIIVWKSRRMIMSWTALCYFVWLAIFHKSQRLYVISRVEGESAGEGARELIWRIGWIAQHLRGFPVVVDIQKLSVHFCHDGHNKHDICSTITGMGGNEPNKMRQMAANAVFCDEFGFWDKPEEAYTALRPTIEGRGKVIIACSTALGYFKTLVLDESGSWMAPDASMRLKPKKVAEETTHCDGMDAWTNAGNGFRIVKILFWADPRKPQGGAWEANERKGMTERAWRQEMLCEFDNHAGTPVFLHEWQPKMMVVQPEAEDIYEGRPLVVGLDFGYNRPAAVVGCFLFGRWFRVLRAHMGHHIHFTPFMRQLLVFLAEWFPGRQQDEYLWCCDVAGKQVKADADPEIEILRKQFGIRPRFKYSKVEPTLDRIRDFMCDVYRGRPCFQVEAHPSTRLVREALSGGYRYPEARPDKPEPDQAEKDGYYEHVIDAMRYVILNYGGTKLSRNVDLSEVARRDLWAPKDYTV